MSAAERWIANRYEVRQRLGRGGAGAVFLARDHALPRWVAIKQLHSDFEQDSRERFAREAQAAAALSHTNIVTIHDYGEEDGYPYIVMQYIEGETLQEVIDRGALAIPEALQRLEELCAGLAYAHRAGIVHRDIKPSNLMVDAQGVLKIVDFGIARSGGTFLTRAGTVTGTPGYMAPEQVQGRRVDHRADIFAAGAVAYALLSGQRAFHGETYHTIIHAILTQEPAPLTELVPTLDPELNTVVSRALAKDVEDRYQDAESLQLEFRRLRRRLERSTQTRIIPDDHRRGTPHHDAAPRTTPSPSSSHRPLDSPSAASLAEIAQRRAAKIRLALDAAERALAGDDLERALTACEEAALYDPAHADTARTLERVRSAIRRRDATSLVTAARDAIDRTDLAGAAELLERARVLDAAANGLDSVRIKLQRLHAEEQRRQQRRAQYTDAVAQARAALAREDFDHALALAASALTLDDSPAEANDVQHLARLGAERRRAAEAEQRARDVVHAARVRFSGGEYTGALEELRAADPHPVIDEAYAELARTHQQIVAKQLLEEQRRQDELRRQEDLRHREEQQRLADEQRRIEERAREKQLAAEARAAELATIAATHVRIEIPETQELTAVTVARSLPPPAPIAPPAPVREEPVAIEAGSGRQWFSDSFIDESRNSPRQSLISASLLLHAGMAILALWLTTQAVIPEIKDPSLIIDTFVSPTPPPDVKPQPPKPQQKALPAPPQQASAPPPPPETAPVEPPPEPPKVEPPPEPVVEQKIPEPLATVTTPITQSAIVRPGVDIGSADAPIENVDRAPQLKTGLRPRYPDEAVKAGVTSGVVLLKLTIDNRGNVVRVSVVQSVPLLDASAIEAAEKFIFEPARRRGIAVFSTVLYRVVLAAPKP